MCREAQFDLLPASSSVEVILERAELYLSVCCVCRAKKARDFWPANFLSIPDDPTLPHPTAQSASLSWCTQVRAYATIPAASAPTSAGDTRHRTEPVEALPSGGAHSSPAPRYIGKENSPQRLDGLWRLGNLR